VTAKTKIEWTDATWNPILGCSRVSEGCRHCYAEGIAARFAGSKKPSVYSGLAVMANGHPQWTGKIAETKQLLDPLHWRRPRRVFVNSMSDLFHENVTRKMLVDIAVVMTLCYWHTFQILTKRPENAGIWPAVVAEAMQQCLRLERNGGTAPAGVFGALDLRRRDKMPWVEPLPNVWLGVSIENQPTADERIPLLLETPAALHFVSAEPLLGLVNVERWVGTLCVHEDSYTEEDTGATVCRQCETEALLDWVICGGESGREARPMDPEWARSLRDQCKAADVPFFMKQMGSAFGPHKGHELPAELDIKQFPVTK
jgi:protein gp37